MEDDLAAFGLVAEGPVVADDSVEIWPENWVAVQTFVQLSTQWRLSPGGELVGLDYAAIPPVLELTCVAAADRPDVFAALRVMEQAALKEFADG